MKIRDLFRTNGDDVFTPCPSTALAPLGPLFSSSPSTSISINSEGPESLTIDSYARRWPSMVIRSRSRIQPMTFDMLPDDASLKIFDFYVDEDVDAGFGLFEKQRVEEWKTLARVPTLEKSRFSITTSPQSATLLDTLDIWPPLPLIIHDPYGIPEHWNSPSDVDNIVAAIEHNDRVCRIELISLSSSQLEHVADSAANKPFPELTDLLLGMFKDDGPGSILPDSFLGGTAPRLRSLDLRGIPFPGLPKLLLSATHLVHLILYGVPPSGYMSPEAMATSLSALTSLELLRLHFRHPRPRPALEGRRPPPLTRSILPSLTEIRFKGTSEYLEVILARIDTPQLNELQITFFNQIIFDTPQLFQFISRRPTLRAPEKCHIAFRPEAIIVKFPPRTSDYGVLNVQIPCTASEWQLSSLKQVCTSSLPPVSTLEDLYIYEDIGCPQWQDDFENTLWLDLLRSFVAVKNLYLSGEFVPRIGPALQELVEEATITEVLPSLENIFWERFQPTGPLHEGIENFVAARRLTGYPVAVSSLGRERHWEIFHW